MQSIKDVSKELHFQKYDVDFICTTKSGNEQWIEVKYDRETERTRHIVYETKSNGNVGCLARSIADLVLYITDKNIYWFDLEELRNYIYITKPKEITMGDNARGYLLELDELLKIGKVHIASQ